MRKAKKDVPHYILAAGVIVMKGKVLLAQRRSGGLLGGMWEFPNGRVDRDPVGGLTKVLRSGYRLKIQRREALGIFKHAYSHFKITVHAFECGLSSKSKNEGLRWVALKDLEEYPMGKVDRQIAKKVAEILESRQI